MLLTYASGFHTVDDTVLNFISLGDVTSTSSTPVCQAAPVLCFNSLGTRLDVELSPGFIHHNNF